MIYNNFYKNVCATIFGSPRVGNIFFVNAIENFVRDKIKSYQIYNDMVNKAPLLQWGYLNLRNEIKLGKLRWFWPFSLKEHYKYGEYL